MKVLMISSVPITKNGITNVIINLITSIHDDSISFDLVCKNEPDVEYYQVIEAQKGKIIVIPRSTKHPIAYMKKLISRLKEEHYDIIHAHGNSSSLCMEMIAGYCAGVKVRIAHSHNTTCSNIVLHKLLNPVFQKFCTNALACGTEAGKWLFGNRVFTVIKNGIKIEDFRFSASKRNQIRKQYGIAPCSFLIGHVGTLNQQKNQEFLIYLFAQCKAQIGNIKLLLIGDGKKKKDLINQISKLGLQEDVILTGSIQNVSDHLSAMDLIVMPSLYEGLPLSLIEQQASGLVCIVSDSITREVDLSGNIQFLGLGSESEWKKEILFQYESGNIAKRYDRSIAAIQKIAENGYSITDEAEKVRALYYLLYNQAKSYGE